MLLGKHKKRQLINYLKCLSFSLTFPIYALSSVFQPAHAEGSRNLYPTNTGSRANLEWRTNSYGAGNFVIRRTLLKVYANAGEYILLGSSAVTSGGDILVYNPSRVTGSVANEFIPATPDFKCSSQAGTGFISSRALELAGPKAISGGGNPSGYTPCYYQAPGSGVYDVVIYGPTGLNDATDGGPTADVTLSSAANFNATQGSSVAAWDVTVRSSTTSTTDLTGRLYSYYLSLFTGGNGLPLYSTIYFVTTDGYKYQTDIRGLDPNGFVVYGNQIGFLDTDGKTPLYHDIVGQDGQVSSPDGGVTLAAPQFPIFFNPPNTIALSNVNIYDPYGSFIGTGIAPFPIAPSASGFSYSGTAGGNNSHLNTGGTFTFNSGTSGNYEIVIQGSGSADFDPTNVKNRVLRGVMLYSGSQSVAWDGKDNSGNFFPVGTNYPVHLRVRGGEYHFPMLDAENNSTGGPTITLLNPPGSFASDLPGFGIHTAFFDDRVYKTLNGNIVQTGGTVGQPLCGINPPSPAYSNAITGFDTTSINRQFGQSGNTGNANTKCNGSFGDTKGLDMWTFFPSSVVNTVVNIVNQIDLTITKTHPGNFTQSGTGSYTLTVTNIGTTTSAGTVTVTDTLPTGLTFNGTPTGTGWACSTSGQVATCTRSTTVGAGASYPVITVNVNVAANANPSVINNATVAGGGESNTSNDTASDTTIINTPPDLTIAKTDSGNLLQNTNTGTFTLTVTNSGGTATSGLVTVKDILPSSFGTWRSVSSASGWTCNRSKTNVNNDTLTCTRSDALAAGTSYPPIIYTVAVFSNAPNPTTNTATVSGGGEPNTNTYTSNDSASDTVNTIPTSDLTITKTHSGNFTQGGTGSYTITVTNSGSLATSGTVNVTDSLPTGLTPTAASGTGWTCSISAPNVSCNRSTALAKNTSYPAITITVAVASSASSQTNTATVSGGNEGDTTNDSASDPTTVVGTSKLILLKRVTAINGSSTRNTNDNTQLDVFIDDGVPNWPIPTSYRQGATSGGVIKSGDEVEYTIYFLVNGANPVQNAIFCDLIPSGTTFNPIAFNAFKSNSGIALYSTNIALPTSSAPPPAPTTYLTNANDADGGQYVSPGTTPSSCTSGSNTNGAIVVNLNTATGSATLPNATGQGTPAQSYGFIRFRVKVN